ncbi:hypothetical protein D7X99_19710 [Corallococcus sp. AB032C]|nr:hypothetical protein D7X99_19710 [Corallococcus sp. AB032C]
MDFMRWGGAAAVALLATAGCSKGSDAAGSPEDVYRRFMLANLTGDEQAIRPLILDHPDAALLWPGKGYPKDVADALGAQTREMKITRLKEAPDSVVLQSPASPLPMEVRRVNGEWKLDASPIIEFRKRASASH